MTYPSHIAGFAEDMKISDQKNSPSVLHLNQLVGGFDETVFCTDMHPMRAKTNDVGNSAKMMLILHSVEVAQMILDLNQGLWEVLETPVTNLFGEVNLERFLALNPDQEVISLSATTHAVDHKSPHHIFLETDVTGEITKLKMPICHPQSARHAGAWSTDRVNLWNALLDTGFAIIDRPRPEVSFAGSIRNRIFYGGRMRGLKEQTTGDPDPAAVSQAPRHWSLSTVS